MQLEPLANTTMPLLGRLTESWCRCASFPSDCGRSRGKKNMADHGRSRVNRGTSCSAMVDYGRAAGSIMVRLPYLPNAVAPSPVNVHISNV